MGEKDSEQGIPVLPVALGAGAMLAGILLMIIVWSSSKNTPDHSPPSAPGEDARNRWIRVEGASGKSLGTSAEMPPSVRGFRPLRQVLATPTPFEMQQHEVTWGELEPWLQRNPQHAFQMPTTGAAGAETPKSLPVQGVPWAVANAYCQSIGGKLPTEEQWEWAARGPTMNVFPWGNDPPDWTRLAAFQGEKGAFQAVMSNAQDRTPGPAENAIYDLAGNVQEWTASVWRDDFPGTDESWVQYQDVIVYAVRGFPLRREVLGRPDELSMAYRDWICAVGDCSPLSSGASARECARKPKLELWAGPETTKNGAIESRRIFESPYAIAALSRCFSGPISTVITVKASKESFCKLAERSPANGQCEGQPALLGTLWRVSGGLSETITTCVNHTLHDLSVTNMGTDFPDSEFSYRLYVASSSLEGLRDVGFRCVRDISSP